MKIGSTVFAAILLSSALAVPAALAAPNPEKAAATEDQGKSKDKKKQEENKARQEEQSQAAEDRAAERGKATNQEDHEPDSDVDDTRFQGLDRDGDGRITREEWQGNDVSFRQHDTNGDGVLAGAEIATREPLTDNEDPADDWKEWWDFHQGQFDTGAFDGMDKDENQVVSRQEWAGSAALFDRLDRDHDGVISKAEYEDREFRSITREALFGRLDVNANGRLEPSEWWWSRETFSMVDRDGDGWVSRDEFMHRGEGR